MATQLDDRCSFVYFGCPYDPNLTFRSEVRPQLHLASAGRLVIGCIFIGYFVTTPQAGFAGILEATVEVFMLYITWVSF